MEAVAWHDQPVAHSESLREAFDGLLAELSAWAASCIDRYGSQPPTHVHDQLTYTTAWEPLVRAGGTAGQRALAFMKQQRDAVQRHFVSTGQWRHGYWLMNEAHHGTEHFELFLGCLGRLDASDRATAAQVEDMAEHLGNWSPDVPDWFDHGTGLFHSMFFGAEGIKADPGLELNRPDHIRCANIALIAHALTAKARYLDLATNHMLRWAEAILSGPELPLGIAPSGALYVVDEAAMRRYHQYVGAAPVLTDPVARAENLVASNGVGALLGVWQRCGQERALAAVEKLLDIVATQLGDPDAGPAADAVRIYRRATESARYDEAVLAAAAGLRPRDIKQLTVKPVVHREQKLKGIGKRGDMPDWLEDGRPRRCNAILLALAAEIRSDEQLARDALDLARAYLAAARAVYPDGREHGCSARTVSAIARGHGRDNHAGVTTAVLLPLMTHFGR